MLPPPEIQTTGRPHPAFEFDLPADGVRIRVRAPHRPARFAAALGSGAALVAAGLWVLADPAPPPGLLAGLALAGLLGLLWRVRSGADAHIAFDRNGIHDAAAGLPPIAWSVIGRLAVGAHADVLVAHPGPAAGPHGVLLPGTRAEGLPVPFEYLILQLHRRGAPVRAPDPAFDPFDCDARWLAPRQAAALVQHRLAARARPYAAQNLDIAETRSDRPAARHWQAVSAELRRHVEPAAD